MKNFLNLFLCAVFLGIGVSFVEASHFGQVSISQNVGVSTLNTSSTNLSKNPDIGYIFTGLADSTLGVNAIQVTLKTDQNCVVYVDQSPDNTPTANAPHWDQTDTYNYYAAVNNFGITVQAVGAYFRVRVVNSSTTTSTSYFRLTSILCPIVEALPRSLDAMGNLKVAVKSSSDEYGFISENTPLGEVRIVEPFKLVGTIFEGNTIDVNYWVTGASGVGASCTQLNGSLLLTSGIASGSTVTAYSVRRGRFLSGYSMRYRATIQLGDTGTANSVRRWGLCGSANTATAITDGIYFQLSNAEFSCNVTQSGNNQKITSFNGTLGGSYAPGVKYNLFEIYYTPSTIYFVLEDQVLHYTSINDIAFPSFSSFYIFMSSTNTGVLPNTMTIKTKEMSIYRLGKEDCAPISKHLTAATALILKNGSGRLRRVIYNTFVNGATVTFYDAVTATNPIAIMAPTNNIYPGTVFYDVDFYTGLCVTITGTADLTLVYE
jgi:hypothetical protein